MDAADRPLYSVLRVYFDTGARPGELTRALVQDYLPDQRVLVLGGRRVGLTPISAQIVSQHCVMKGNTDLIFDLQDAELRLAKLRASLEMPRFFTLQSFRDRWIADLLQLGTSVDLVARMAGTTPSEIHRLYGEYRDLASEQAQRKLHRFREQFWR
jgi:integrase